MRRPVVLLLLVGALALGACGTPLSGTAAMVSWARAANFTHNTATLTSDARHAVTALGEPTSSPNLLHTVCGVLQTDDEAAYNSLPTPDASSTNLLSRAYNALGVGASHCYDAGTDPARRARALGEIAHAVAQLAEGVARVGAAMTP